MQQRILDAALALFAQQGYWHTTIRDIATQAGCSPGLVYHYFDNREDMIRIVYWQLGDETARADFPPARLDVCFTTVMESKLAQFQPHREALAALFGSVMNPHSPLSFIGGEGWVDPMQAVFEHVALNAIDSVSPQQAENMGKALYSVYLLTIIFWLYDRSAQQAATHRFVGFMGEVLRLVRPMLMMPMFAKALAQFADIVSEVFGKAHPVTAAPHSDESPRG